MKSTEPLMHILNEQLNGYSKLFELLQRERLCLLDMNAYCIEEISKAKDTLILKLRLLEDERVRLAEDFAGSETTIQRIAEHTGNDALLEIRSRLVSMLHNINELNMLNRLLMDRCLNHVRVISNFFSFYGLNSDRPGDIMRGKGVMLSGEI